MKAKLLFPKHLVNARGFIYINSDAYAPLRDGSCIAPFCKWETRGSLAADFIFSWLFLWLHQSLHLFSLKTLSCIMRSVGLCSLKSSSAFVSNTSHRVRLPNPGTWCSGEQLETPPFYKGLTQLPRWGPYWQFLPLLLAVELLVPLPMTQPWYCLQYSLHWVKNGFFCVSFLKNAMRPIVWCDHKHFLKIIH